MKKYDLPLWRIDNMYGFFVSIAVSVFAFASLYFGLSLKIELLNQKVDYLVERTKEYNDKNKDIQARLGSAEKDIEVIYSRLSITK